MIVRVLKNLAGPDVAYWPGDFVEALDAIAETWIADSAAEPLTPEAFPVDAIVRVHQPVAV